VPPLKKRHCKKNNIMIYLKVYKNKNKSNPKLSERKKIPQLKLMKESNSRIQGTVEIGVGSLKRLTRLTKP
jgi:hypothetical protein